MFEFNVKTEFEDNFSTKSAISRQDLHCPTQQSGEGMMKLKEHTAKNLALALFGTVTAVAQEAFTNVLFPTGITAGQTHRVPGGRAKLSGVTLVDNAGTAFGAGEAIIDPLYGTVKFVNITGKTQPFKISGTAGVSERVAILTKRVTEKFIRFHGINIADGDKPCIAEIYRASLEPAEKAQLKGQGKAEYSLKFTMLDDATKPESEDYGRYANYALL